MVVYLLPMLFKSVSKRIARDFLARGEVISLLTLSSQDSFFFFFTERGRDHK